MCVCWRCMQCLRVWRMGGIWNACVGLRFQPWNMYIGHNTTIRIWRSIETYIHEHTNALRPAVRDKFRYDNVSFPYTERCYECEQFLRTHTHTHTLHMGKICRPYIHLHARKHTRDAEMGFIIYNIRTYSERPKCVSACVHVHMHCMRPYACVSV